MNSIEIRADGDLWSVVADPGQLESAVLNLAINARDAMPNGGTLIIETSNVTFADDADIPAEISPGDYAMLAVTDTGSGIPEDMIDHVIEPFFTTKEVGKGSGLGLSMIYGFSVQSGGSMEIESETGRGTTVRIYLPRGFSRATEAEPRPSTVETSYADTGTVLVVEDDDLVRDVVVEVLRDSDYEVLVADSGEAALAVIDETENVDVLFTDIVMPKMSGLELWTQARSRLPNLKVIYTSGYSEDMVAGWPDSEETSIILRKPYNPSQLLQALRDTMIDENQ
jgi:CheY-like chemotaxis protein